MSGHDLRLVPAAAVAWLAAAWAVSQRPAVLAGAAAVSALGVGAGLLLSARGVRGASAVLLVVTVLAGVLGHEAVSAARRSAGPVHGWARTGAVAGIAAVAVQDAVAVRPGRFPGPPKYLVRVSTRTVEARGRQATVAVPVLVRGGPAWADVTAGQRLRFTARLGIAEPGEGLAAAANAVSAPHAAPGGVLWRAADRVRAGLRRACDGLPPDPRGLLPALVVGDTARLPPDLVADLRTAGLTHLTAVSGANVAIVAAAAAWLVTSAGAGRTSRVWLALLAVAGFVVLARPQPSVLRAAVMGGVALLGLLRARRPRGVPLLCGAVVLLLVVSPRLSRAPGFVLSVTATAALVLLAPAWAARLERWLPRPVALAVAVPAAAQAACGPVVVLLSPTVSTTAVPANLLAAPAVAPATVLGVVAALASLVRPGAAAALAWVGGLATGWIAQVAHRAAALPGAALPWPPGRPGAALLAALTAVAVAVTLRVAPREPGAEPDAEPAAAEARTGTAARPDAGRVPARTALVVAGVAAALALGWLLGPRAAAWLTPGGGTRPWAVAMCDVGQGDMLVARSGAHRAVVVDVGPDPALADRCLRRLDVRRVDLLLLTHFHADHVDGLPGVLRHGRTVGGAVVSRLPEPADNAASVHRRLAAARTPRVEGRAGLAGSVGSDGWRIDWHVLRADVPAAAGAEADPDGAVVNESSVATELVVTGPGGSVRVLDLGDLEDIGQAALLSDLESGRIPLGGPVDVVKVAHHGSATQDPELYQWVAAPVALVGVGADNDYGHPAPRTLRLLDRLGTRVERTDTDGTVLLGPRSES